MLAKDSFRKKQRRRQRFGFRGQRGYEEEEQESGRFIDRDQGNELVSGKFDIVDAGSSED